MKNYLGLFALFFGLISHAQPPEGYYDDAEGLNGEALRDALADIIDGHDIQSYSSLWTHFQVTDSIDTDKVWDMYSDVPGGTPDYTYTFVSDQCGNYSGEGDCYNREHSFPKSWFGGNIPPMYTDLFHLVPSDGYTNGQRGNYPYGETDNASWTSTNGSKRGPSSYPGYTGTIFEPIDEYKGDFARNYFYMLTRYKDDVDGWSSPMLDGDDFSSWAKDLLLEWSANDTVSQKEIDRNNAVYEIQDNRNPFIDRPEFITLIWDLASGIENQENFSFSVYYAYNEINISKPSEALASVYITDIQGKQLLNAEIADRSTRWTLDIESGIYIITLIENGRMRSEKIAIIRN